VSDFVLIHPRDDGAARVASDWGKSLETALGAKGHKVSVEVTDVRVKKSDLSPADTTNISSALGEPVNLICYLGHGDTHNWLTGGAPTVSSKDFIAAKSKAIVSIACKTGRSLGPDANTAGVEAWLGFSSKVAVVNTNGRYPIGDAIVDGLSVLGSGKTMQEARDEVYAQLDQVVKDYDMGGKYQSHSTATLGYFSALAMRDHLVLHGTASFAPL
jgi:hypothetical protein